MIDPRAISNELAQEAFTDGLRRYVGRGKDWSVSDLAEQTSIDERTIHAYRGGEAAPCLYRLLRIAAVLGPAFMSDVLAPAGMGGVERIGQSSPDAHQTAERLVEQASDVLKRLSDGQFCHRDRAAVGPRLVELARFIEEQGRAMCDEQRPRVVDGGRP